MIEIDLLEARLGKKPSLIYPGVKAILKVKKEGKESWSWIALGNFGPQVGEGRALISTEGEKPCARPIELRVSCAVILTKSSSRFW